MEHLHIVRLNLDQILSFRGIWMEVVSKLSIALSLLLPLKLN
jgi:hypothetical protein